MQAILMLCLGLAGGGEEPKKNPTPPAYELVMKANVLARGSDVRVGEIADVLPAGLEAAAIGKIVFSQAPVTGYARTVSRNDLLQVLAAAGQQAGRFACKGALESIVQSVTSEIPPQEITDAAEAALQALLAHEGAANCEIELQSRVRHLQAPAGRESRELRAHVRDGKTAISAAVVDVEVIVDGSKHSVLPVQYRIVRFTQVLRLTESLKAGSTLGPDNLELAREKQTATPGMYASKFEQVAGMIARRDLKAGQILTLNDIGEPALVHRGERVTVVLTQGRVKVWVKGIANSDAARGERLTVTNADSRAQIEGVVAAPGTVLAVGK
jgi:flagella basal body P-ring formation protein FlgA